MTCACGDSNGIFPNCVPLALRRSGHRKLSPLVRYCGVGDVDGLYEAMAGALYIRVAA